VTEITHKMAGPVQLYLARAVERDVISLHRNIGGLFASCRAVLQVPSIFPKRWLTRDLTRRQRIFGNHQCLCGEKYGGESGIRSVSIYRGPMEPTTCVIIPVFTRVCNDFLLYLLFPPLSVIEPISKYFGHSWSHPFWRRVYVSPQGFGHTLARRLRSWTLSESSGQAFAISVKRVRHLAEASFLRRTDGGSCSRRYTRM